MRREKQVTITDEGRDIGKRFLITEMSAAQAEKWATRALLVASKGGVGVPEEMMDAGFLGIAAVGIQWVLTATFADAEPLMLEMMACVQACPDDKRPWWPTPMINGGDSHIEEVKTRLLLRREVMDLHLGFSLAAELSKVLAAKASRQALQNTEMSLAPSDALSAAA